MRCYIEPTRVFNKVNDYFYLVNVFKDNAFENCLCKTVKLNDIKLKKQQFYNNFIHSLSIKCVWWKECANARSLYSRKSHIQLSKKGDFGVMNHSKICSEYEKCPPGIFC